VKYPDLAIYSQAEQLANDVPPTWNNPDIVTHYWRPFRLAREAQVTVRNLSAAAPAVNALVHFHTCPFGIGTRRELRLSRRLSLAPGEEIRLSFPLHAELMSADPRTGVHVEIEHPRDSNRLNNSGAQIHDGGYTSESGRDFPVLIPVVNDRAEARRIRLSIQPTDLIATLDVSSHDFAPFEQLLVNLRIVVPAFLSGTPDDPINRSVTVIGWAGDSGELVGGITRLVRVDD